MNLYEASISSTPEQLEVSLGSQWLSLPAEVARNRPELAAANGRRLVVGIRPEDLTPPTGRDANEPEHGGHLLVDVELVEALGNEQLVHFATDASRFHDGTETWQADDETEGVATRIAGAAVGKGVARVDPRVRVVAGERITLAVDVARLHFFDPDTGLALTQTESAPQQVGA